MLKILANKLNHELRSFERVGRQNSHVCWRGFQSELARAHSGVTPPKNLSAVLILGEGF
jgi:hypothetical protein